MEINIHIPCIRHSVGLPKSERDFGQASLDTVTDASKKDQMKVTEKWLSVVSCLSSIN